MNTRRTVYTYNSTNQPSKFKIYMKFIIVVLVFIAISLSLSSCMPSVDNYPVDSPAGFFSGIWHGWIAPISLVFSFFGDNGIYAVNNTGFPYDFGFYMAIVSGFGGLSFSRNKHKTNYFYQQDTVHKYENEV